MCNLWHSCPLMVMTSFLPGKALKCKKSLPQNPNFDHRNSLSKSPHVAVVDHVVYSLWVGWCVSLNYIMHQSVNSGCQHLPPPPDNPGVLHLLSAQVPGFVRSELPRGCRGVGPIIYYQSTKLSVNAAWRNFSAEKLKLIYHLLLLSCYKICFKAGIKLWNSKCGT